MQHHSSGFWLLAAVGVFFAIVALISGFWMYAPFIVIAVLFLLLLLRWRKREL
jgi:hypothetical protein